MPVATRQPAADLPNGDARHALARLALAVLLAMAPWFTTAAIVTQLRGNWQLTGAQAAWLTIAAQLGFVAGALISALLNLADLLPPRWLVLSGGLAAALANAAVALCHGFGSALPWRFLTGACLALVYPPALKLIATWFRHGRGTALGIMVGALTVGSALPHLVNALGGADWRTVVLVTSIITAAGGLLGAAGGQPGPFPFARSHFEPRQVGLVFRDRGLRLTTISYVGHMWEMIAMWSWIGPFMSARFAQLSGSTSPARAAALTAFLVIAAGGLGCWYDGWLSDRTSREWAAGLALAISGSCALTLGWIDGGGRMGLVVLVAGALIWGFWIVADSAQYSTLITELADARYVGTALTTELGLGFSLAGITVWLLPWLQSHAGWGWAFSGLALGPLAGLIALTRLHQRRSHRQAMRLDAGATRA